MLSVHYTHSSCDLHPEHNICHVTALVVGSSFEHCNGVTKVAVKSYGVKSLEVLSISEISRLKLPIMGISYTLIEV